MKTLTGLVTSTKSLKTATVAVTRFWRHPLYRKQVKRTKKFAAHDELGVKPGDTVVLAQTRPLSKNKHFKITKIINKTVSP